MHVLRRGSLRSHVSHPHSRLGSRWPCSHPLVPRLIIQEAERQAQEAKYLALEHKEALEAAEAVEVSALPRPTPPHHRSSILTACCAGALNQCAPRTLAQLCRSLGAVRLSVVWMVLSPLRHDTRTRRPPLSDPGPGAPLRMLHLGHDLSAEAVRWQDQLLHLRP